MTTAACGGDNDAKAKDKGDLPQGDPVKIGLFDPSAGGYKSPGVGVGARAALDHINYEIGGIHERPVEFVTCATDGTPETTVACANKMVEEKVVVALDGFNTTSSAGIDILTSAKIPLVGGIVFDNATGESDENRVFFSAPPAAFLVGALQAWVEQGKKSVTLAAADIPATHVIIDDNLKPLGQQLGLEVNGQYFDPAQPNFNTLAAAIKEQNPDVGGLMAAPDPSACTKLVQGLRKLDYQGTIFTAACTEFIKQAPGDAEGAALYSSHWLPQAVGYAPDAVKDDLKIAEDAIKEEGGLADFYAYAEFSIAVTLAEALNASPDAALEGPEVLKTLKGLKDFESFLGPKLNCGLEGSPNCTSQMLLFEVDDKGGIEPATGDWITTPVTGQKQPG